MAPICFVCLIPPVFLFEFERLRLDTDIRVTPFIALTNAMSAFGKGCGFRAAMWARTCASPPRFSPLHPFPPFFPVLNCAIFLLLGKTSALTMNIGGVIKDWVLIALSVGIFHNAVTPVNLAGYFIAFIGVSVYNYTKIRDAQAAANAPQAERTDDRASLLNKDRP